MRRPLLVHKLDEQGRSVWSYPSSLLAEKEQERIVEAFYDRGPIDLGLIELRPGYRMLEHFYSNRWFNIFQIFDLQDELVGWYCNLTRPAEFTPGEIRQQDLALDLVVNPQGETELLDESEFEDLDLSTYERKQAAAALAELRALINERTGPFAAIEAAG